MCNVVVCDGVVVILTVNVLSIALDHFCECLFACYVYFLGVSLKYFWFVEG